jgi:hypothetical protein
MKNLPEQFKAMHSGEEFPVMNQTVNEAGALIIGFSSPSLLDVLLSVDKNELTNLLTVGKANFKR